MHRSITPSARSGLLPRPLLALTLAVCAALSACEQLGIETPEKIAAAKEADGRAVGGACRHAGRAIEDCYSLYKKADRAAVFAGWRDMNDYMRENKIETVSPVMAGQQPAAAPAAPESGDEASEGRDPPKKVAKAGAH